MTRPSALKKIGKDRRRRQAGKYVPMPSQPATSTDTTDEHEKTYSPTAPIDAHDHKFSVDGTQAPTIGESQEERQEYVGTAAGLVDKYVLSGKIMPIVVFSIMGLIFFVDNWHQQLKSWKDVLWTAKKCLAFFCFYVVYLIYVGITKLWKKQSATIISEIKKIYNKITK